MSDPEVRRLESTDAFVVWDLPGADAADGGRACARKVLVDSTKALARSRFYSWALLSGQRVGGASAAINAGRATRGAAIAAFCEELARRWPRALRPRARQGRRCGRHLGSRRAP
ncbi:MAG: hypothetical protein R2716_04270 [Microthrixaceae bacterium]